MRNISFMLTTAQFLDGSKDVTRRMGWLFAKPGMVLCAVAKSQGLGKGGKIKRLGYIELIDVRGEPLRRMIDDHKYGVIECRREGFPGHTPAWFVNFFCKSHRGCRHDTKITRIEYKKIARPANANPES